MTHVDVKYVDSFSGEVILKGVPYGDFDRTGHWSIWNTSKFLSSSEHRLEKRGLRDFALLYEGGSTFFVLKQRIRLSPRLHRDLNLFTKSILKVNVETLYIGSTSIISKQILVNGLTNEWLGEGLIVIVYIDGETRKPKPFPAWYKRKYEKCNQKIDFGFKKIPDKPTTAYKTSTIIRHSDTDGNNHTNQSVYLKICMDCATKASISGSFKDFTSDMCWYPVVEADFQYIDESLAGDTLDVFTWQGKDDICRIYCSVYKSEKLIFFVQFLFNRQKSLKTQTSKF